MAFIPPVAGGAAATVGKALMGITTTEAAKKLADGFRDLKAFSDEGAEKITGMFRQLETVFGVINPLIAPLQVLTATITSETAAASIKLMTSLLDMVTNPTFELGLKSISLLISGILELLNLLVGGTEKWLSQFDGISKGILSMITSFEQGNWTADAPWVGKLTEAIKQFVLKLLLDALDAITLGLIPEDAVQNITDWLSRALGLATLPDRTSSSTVRSTSNLSRN